MLKDKVAIVTGSASGIGFATAKGLAEEGVKVVMGDFNEALLKESAGKIGAVPVVADLSKRESCRNLVDVALEKYGRVDILCNIAGIQNVAPIVDFPEDKWDTIISLMLTAPFLLTKYCWNSM